MKKHRMEIKKRSQHPFEVTLLQIALRKKSKQKEDARRKRSVGGGDAFGPRAPRADSKKGVKKKKKVLASRICSGTLISELHIITTTSCLSYAEYIWEKKFRRKQQTTLSNLYTRKKRDVSDNHEGGDRRRQKAEGNPEGQRRRGENGGMVQRERDTGNDKPLRRKVDGGVMGRRLDDSNDNPRRKEGDGVKIKRKGDDDKPPRKVVGGLARKMGEGQGGRRRENGGEGERRGQRLRNPNAQREGNGPNRGDGPRSREPVGSRRRSGKVNSESKAKDKENVISTKGFSKPRLVDIAMVVGRSSIQYNKLKREDVIFPKSLYIDEACIARKQQKRVDGVKRYNMHCPVIVMMRKKVEITKEVRPICLPSIEMVKFLAKKAYVLGRGAEDLQKKNAKPTEYPVAHVLRRVKKGSKCQRKLKNQYLDESYVCTVGSKKTSSMCVGDEGAPLFQYFTGDGYKKRTVLTGILATPGCPKKKKKKKKDKNKDEENDAENGARRLGRPGMGQNANKGREDKGNNVNQGKRRMLKEGNGKRGGNGLISKIRKANADGKGNGQVSKMKKVVDGGGRGNAQPPKIRKEGNGNGRGNGEMPNMRKGVDGGGRGNAQPPKVRKEGNRNGRGNVPRNGGGDGEGVKKVRRLSRQERQADEGEREKEKRKVMRRKDSGEGDGNKKVMNSGGGREGNKDGKRIIKSGGGGRENGDGGGRSRKLSRGGGDNKQDRNKEEGKKVRERERKNGGMMRVKEGGRGNGRERGERGNQNGVIKLRKRLDGRQLTDEEKEEKKKEQRKKKRQRERENIRRKQPDKYTRKRTNEGYLDMYIRVDSFLTWMLKVVMGNKKFPLCYQAPKVKTAPNITDVYPNCPFGLEE